MQNRKITLILQKLLAYVTGYNNLYFSCWLGCALKRLSDLALQSELAPIDSSGKKTFFGFAGRSLLLYRISLSTPTEHLETHSMEYHWGPVVLDGHIFQGEAAKFAVIVTANA